MRNPKMVVTVVAVMAGVGDDKHNIESALPQHYTNRNFILFYFILVYFFTFLRFLLSDDSRYTHPAAFHRRGEGVL